MAPFFIIGFLLFGMTHYGGINNYGVIFQINTEWIKVHEIARF